MKSIRVVLIRVKSKKDIGGIFGINAQILNSIIRLELLCLLLTMYNCLMKLNVSLFSEWSSKSKTSLSSSFLHLQIPQFQLLLKTFQLILMMASNRCFNQAASRKK